MLIGYSRVSTPEQSHDLQIDALLRDGVDQQNIYKDTCSAVARRRPQFDIMWSSLRKGDVVVVWRLDRLARSIFDLLTRFQEMERMGVGIKSLTESIDTTTAAGRLIFHVIGALGEFERQLIVERTQAGLQAAKARGKKLGRGTIMVGEKLEQAKKLAAEGKSPGKIAAALGVSRTTIINHIDKIRPPKPVYVPGDET